MDQHKTHALPRLLAIYWDLENVVASRYDEVHGTGSWRSDNHKHGPERQQRLRDAEVDMDAVMSAFADGPVLVNRAYGNWTAAAMRRYEAAVHRHAIDTVQLFPVAGAKNGADIRLALDVAADLRHYPAITHVVVVGADSDYIALAQHCHRHLYRFISVAVAGSASRHLRSAADETLAYSELVAAPAPEEYGTPVEQVVVPIRSGQAAELPVCETHAMVSPGPALGTQWAAAPGSS